MTKLSVTEYAAAYKPFHYPWAIDLAIKHDKAHWGEWEAELQDDINQWKTNHLTSNEKNHITNILKLFTQTDVQVGANYCDFFLPVFKNHEVRQMLMSFASREAIHQRAYALLNDTLGLSESIYTEFLGYKELKDKIDFMSIENVTENASKVSKHKIAKTLAQTVCNEGMSLFSAFAMLLHYQRFGKMKGMCTIVEWSARDESIHVEGMAQLFKTYCIENPRVVNDELKASIYIMYTKAVELEDAVIDLAFSQGPIENLAKEDVKQYIRFIADRRLNQLGLKSLWNIETNPLSWLDWILNGDTFSNFFEKRVSDYSSGSLIGDWGWGDESK